VSECKRSMFLEILCELIASAGGWILGPSKEVVDMSHHKSSPWHRIQLVGSECIWEKHDSGIACSGSTPRPTTCTQAQQSDTVSDGLQEDTRQWGACVLALGESLQYDLGANGQRL